VLFDVHSLKAITGEAPPMLMTAADRDKLIADSGFVSYELNFGKIKDLTPDEFIDTILKERLNAKAVVCGYNYRFGKNAVGDADLLRELCGKRGIECSIIGEVDFDGTAVSSTSIRRAIENGDIKNANRMLGREFGFSAEVINGDKRGRTWGFPTINQLLPENLVMPKFGVYSSTVTVDSEEYKGVTNIGKRPTIGTDVILSETNILDFDKDIYGKTVGIKLREFLRAENKFNSFDELVKQINSDVQRVRRGE
jgi:riboflavin kinase/FMN adenylyltransferase